MAEITPPEKDNSPTPATPAQANVGTPPTTSSSSGWLKKNWYYVVGALALAAIVAELVIHH